jgi:uncharacterized protein YceK
VKKTIGLIAGLAMIVVVLSGCEGDSKESSSEKGQKLTEQAFAQQDAAVPYPVNELKDSQERRNLRERLLRQNDPDRIGYVYFVQFGKFMGYWTITGKVSSTQSQMTPSDLTEYACNDEMSGCQAVIKEAPGDDGSYGANEPGVFFFTTEGAMVQLPEDSYVYADQPIAIGDIPELNGTETVKSAE